MAARFDLVAFRGPVLGMRVPLDQSGPNLLGRASTGVHIPDPTVSLKHAEVFWEDGTFWARDLQSSQGTFVDGERLAAAPHRLVPGSVIEVGESSFVLEDRPGWPLWLHAVLAVAVSALGLSALVVWGATREIAYTPSLAWSEPIAQGSHISPRLDLPLSVVRQLGRDHRHLRVHHVSDHDHDGRDEVWLQLGSKLHAYTFAPDGAWVRLGEVPSGCIEQEMATLPDLACDGYRLRWTGEGWKPISHEGVVVWLNTTLKVPEGEPPARAVRPHRVTLANPERLSGFLEARGVKAPLHYLLCDGAVPGLPAQALLADGRRIALAPGCLKDLAISGKGKANFGAERPLAVAFTAVGHAALRADLALWLGGAPDSIFLEPAAQATLSAWSGQATHALADLRVQFEGPLGAGDPVAPDGVAPPPSAPLVEAGEAVRPASHATLAGPGAAALDPEGCLKLRVETEGWQCSLARFCGGGTAFLRVIEEGCGPPRELFQVPYAGGLARATVEGTEVRARVVAEGGGGQIDVLKAQVGWRSAPPP